MERFKIIVTGSRDWTDWATIYQRLNQYPPGTKLVHGCARGADKIAAYIGRALGFIVIPVCAEWDVYGRAAGSIRNRKMLREHPDALVVEAFPQSHSIGTRDMINVSKQSGRVVYITEG